MTLLDIFRPSDELGTRQKIVSILNKNILLIGLYFSLKRVDKNCGRGS